MSWDKLIGPLAILLLLAWVPGILAQNKGRSFLAYYLTSLFSGLVLLGLPKLMELLENHYGKDKITGLLPTVSVLLVAVVMTAIAILRKDVYHARNTVPDVASVTGKRRSGVSYAKWGYTMIYPFFVAYLFFSLIPQFMTIYNSFFENYMAKNGTVQVGPNYVGLDNYVKLFTPSRKGTIEILKYFGNTMTLWVMGAVPQILIALLLAVFFTSYRLKLKGQQFFKTVIYMPNLIMASAFAMLFFTLFNTTGPVNKILESAGIEAIDFLSLKIPVRVLISLMNFLMWFGNTTILLMAGIQGIDQNMFEAAEIDGASSLQVFFRVTLPLLAPILVYTVITAMIGGLQMFDVPQILTNGKGTPDRASMTIVMNLNNYLGASKNYGMAGAVSVVLFVISAVLSLFVYRTLSRQYSEAPRKRDRV